MRIAYPVLWSRLGRDASQEQTIRTVAALAGEGVQVTLFVPQGPGDPDLTAEDLAAWHGTRDDFAVVQPPSRWSGESALRSSLWLRQLGSDRAFADHDLLYARAPILLAVCGLSPLPFATDQYRPWPDQWPWIVPLVRRTARSPRCLGLVAHSEFAAASYRRAGMPDAKILVAWNGAEIDAPGYTLSRQAARDRLGLSEDCPIAAYSGRINPQKGLDQILALADLRPAVLFLLIGSEGEGAIEVEARRRENVRVLPWQAPDATPVFLRAADVLLIPASRAPLERFGTCVLPLKSFAYLAAGRPILAPRAPDTAELLRDGENAALVEPDRPQAAAAALDHILADPSYADALAAGAAATARGLGWDRRARKIAEFLTRRLDAAQASE